jgi:hypothetical protein
MKVTQVADARASVLAKASSLLSSAKAFRLQRKEQKEKIQICKNTIASHKNEAERVKRVRARGELPSLAETNQRLAELRAANESEKQEQARLKRPIRPAIGVDRFPNFDAQYEKAASGLKALAMQHHEEQQRGRG